MPAFTIESIHWIPVSRHRTYRAASLEEACQLALKDPDWSEQKEDPECASEAYISGAWHGPNAAYNASSIPVPSQFGEAVRRKAKHFETLLGILKLLLTEEAFTPAKLAFWRRRAERAVAKAEAILAGGSDPR
jgi:hypothetical protein